MYKIRHIESKLYFSHTGFRYYYWLQRSRSIEHYVSRNGKTWSTERGVTNAFNKLDRIYPGEFEIVKFVEAN